MVHLRDQWLVLWSKYHDMKGPIQEAREIICNELYSLVRVREIAIVQLSREHVEEDMKSLCIEAIDKRRTAMSHREDEMLRLNDILETRILSIKLAANAVRELDENIRLHDEAAERRCDAGMRRLPIFMHIMLTAIEFIPLSTLKMVDGILYPNVLKLLEENTLIPGAFTPFKRLPLEIRQLIWQYALPGPRILTRSGKHNKKLTLLSVCRESRDVVELKYVRLLRPPCGFDREKTVTILYANPDIDTIVIDLTLPETQESGPDILDRSLFDLPNEEFNKCLIKFFTGLSRVKHLALAFNVADENGGAFFSSLQASCPNLKTLTVFPSSQLHVSTCDQPKLWGKHSLHFIDVDSNLTDFEYFRHDLLPSRRYKEKSFRGLEILYHLEDIAHQYVKVFPEHVERFSQRFGLDWNPTARLCLLTSWNERCNGFQTLHLEGDDYWKGYHGEDGERCEGFIESSMACDAKGEVFSRYDGMKRLFEEDE
jgi:hypothetical protein